jgi:HEAT repeat protein
MHHAAKMIFSAAVGIAMLGEGAALAANETNAAPSAASVDKAFDALKSYNYGTNRDVLKPIDDAVIAAHGDPDACKSLETRLAAVLSSGDSRDAKEFALRRLRIIGTAASVPSIAPLLESKQLSHMARYALELNPSPEAGQALRDALPKVSGKRKIGIIGSLASRRDEQSVPAIAAALDDSDVQLACTAAHALGAIGNSDAAKQLADFLPKAEGKVKAAATDAELVCAESLLKHSKKSEAIAIYKSLMHPDEPKNIRLAATHGLLVAAETKN